MYNDIKSIFNAITPDNIKDVPVIRDAMDIFIETLEDLSKESIDIKNVYENEKYRDYLVQTYLNDLYGVIKAIQLNEEVGKTIDKINSYYNAQDMESPVEYMKREVIDDISKYITDEQFFSIKSYRQKKGNIAALRYIYELISGFIYAEDNPADFLIEEGEPFHLDMAGPLPQEIYEHIIYPLAHPLGFTYSYYRYIAIKLEDYFPGIITLYDTHQLEIRCLFEDGSTSTTTFINNRISDLEQQNLGIDPNLTVIDVQDIVTSNLRTRLVFLSDGTYLRQETTNLGQTQVWHYAGTPEEYDEETLIGAYTAQCSIYLDYTPITKMEDRDSEVFTINFGTNEQEQYDLSETDIRTNIHFDNDLSILIEPVYSPESNFIDYNGEDRGKHCGPYLNNIGNENACLGAAVIGGYMDRNCCDYNNPETTVNPNLTVIIHETEVAGDAVSLQYNTWDKRFEFGVYRNGELLDDNNFAAIDLNESQE